MSYSDCLVCRVNGLISATLSIVMEGNKNQLPKFRCNFIKIDGAFKMKINVIVLAGGSGIRMGGPIPKQYIMVNGAPIIVHTLLNFQKNNLIDFITIVCNKHFIDKTWKIVKENQISKVTDIVAGGETGHDSTRNGVFSLKNKLSDDDFVIIHDAVRPILPQDAINSMIDVALKKGNACLAVPCYETVVITDDKISGNKEIDRNSFMRIQTPQMYKYEMIRRLYEWAERDNIHDSVYANTLAVHYGERIFFSPGFFYNYKITTIDDLPLCKALMSFIGE